MIAIAVVVFVVGLIQVIRPQLLWGMNRRLQKGWVKDPDAAEPTAKGYAVQRVVGVAFIGVAAWMVLTHL
ncbi:DUF6199 family natural product biosynthesis protein [Kitasatospora sp. NPDC096147]|uniref:DUF6199 family natural product biosynthesis protein n=1 Tax=Kitasatospora sp. NPDC096147 TaxID=3364093 RepID=UPI0037FABA98